MGDRDAGQGHQEQRQVATRVAALSRPSGFLEAVPALGAPGGRYSLLLPRLRLRRAQVADRPAHHLVPVGLIGDALEAEAEVEGVRGGGNGPFGEPGRRGPVEVVGVGRAPRRGAGSAPSVQPGLERGGPLAGRDLDVVDEDAQALERPVARIGDGELDLLAREVAQVDLPLLPAAGVPRGGMPGAGGPGGGACRGTRPGSGSGPAAGAGSASRRSSPPCSSPRSPGWCVR